MIAFILIDVFHTRGSQRTFDVLCVCTHTRGNWKTFDVFYVRVRTHMEVRGLFDVLYVCTHTRKLENFLESVLSFYCVGSRDGIQVQTWQ